MRVLIRIFICLFMVFVCGCSKDKKKLVGWWGIDDIMVNHENALTSLDANTLTFTDDGNCSLPLFNFKGTEKGKWHIEEDEDDRYLIIESKNNFMVGRYRLFFFKDPKNKLYKMSLASDSIRMLCSKGLTYYKK